LSTIASTAGGATAGEHVKRDYKARFRGPDVSAVRSALRQSGAHLVAPRTLHKRAAFDSEPIRARGSSLRLYTTENHAMLTLTREEPPTDRIKELETAVIDFDDCRELLEAIGLTTLSYQENYREEWELDVITCYIEECPDLTPFVEIAGPSREPVDATAARLGLADSAALSLDPRAP
jgi:adenylate cyclase, class 2